MALVGLFLGVDEPVLPEGLPRGQALVARVALESLLALVHCPHMPLVGILAPEFLSALPAVVRCSGGGLVGRRRRRLPPNLADPADRLFGLQLLAGSRLLGHRLVFLAGRGLRRGAAQLEALQRLGQGLLPDRSRRRPRGRAPRHSAAKLSETDNRQFMHRASTWYTFCNMV